MVSNRRHIRRVHFASEERDEPKMNSLSPLCIWPQSNGCFPQRVGRGACPKAVPCAGAAARGRPNGGDLVGGKQRKKVTSPPLPPSPSLVAWLGHFSWAIGAIWISQIWLQLLGAGLQRYWDLMEIFRWVTMEFFTCRSTSLGRDLRSRCSWFFIFFV